VLLALIALQFRRYPASQVFAFDFGGSIRAAALAMGGDWHDLGGALRTTRSSPSRFSRLPRSWTQRNKRGRRNGLQAILAREGVTVTPEAKEHLWSALTSLASAPIGERTLTGLSVLLQSGALKRALQPYCVGGLGPAARRRSRALGEADVQAFETEA